LVWTIEITRTAERQIKKLGRQAQASIVHFLRDQLKLAENPGQWGKPLHGDKGGLWRYRVADYRLICDIQDENLPCWCSESVIAKMFIGKSRPARHTLSL
jgi:mRNA interferase RelE/StbE